MLQVVSCYASANLLGRRKIIVQLCTLRLLRLSTAVHTTTRSLLAAPADMDRCHHHGFEMIVTTFTWKYD